jgi:hypothetical protein
MLGVAVGVAIKLLGGIDTAVNPYALAQATARDDRIGIAFS